MHPRLHPQPRPYLPPPLSHPSRLFLPVGSLPIGIELREAVFSPLEVGGGRWVRWCWERSEAVGELGVELGVGRCLRVSGSAKHHDYVGIEGSTLTQNLWFIMSTLSRIKRHSSSSSCNEASASE